TESGSLGYRRWLRIAPDGLRAARDRIDPQFCAGKNSFERLGKMKQGVGAKDRVVIELEIEIPKIDDPFQPGIASERSKKLLPIFGHSWANCVALGIRRGETSSASNRLASGAGGAQPRS